MKILNLYAGLGGNRVKWEGVEVTAVEMEPSIAKVYAENFPGDELVIGDAHEYLRLNHQRFDMVWSSPPCQTHSKMMKATRHETNRFPDLKLYEEIIFLNNFYKGRFVVENVVPYYTPLIPPTLQLGRHLFWANFEIQPIEVGNFKNFIKAGTTAQTEEFKKWLGIRYEGNIYYKGNHCPGQVLRNCVHPDLGLHILSEARKSATPEPMETPVAGKTQSQLTLF